ncbi:g3983 [Coccomyxa elongata]
MGKGRSIKHNKWTPHRNEAEEHGVIILKLTASKEFLHGAFLAECPAVPEVEVDVDNDGVLDGAMTLLLNSSADLESLLTWFREVSDIDSKATLAFPATLSKFQRAKIHGLVKSVGLGSLESVSAGIGDDRFISIVHSGSPRANELTSIQQHKSFWIYQWAKNAHMKVSRDEVAEMLLKDALPEDLEQLWVKGSAQQKLIIKLCQAVVEDDAAVFTEIIASDEGLGVVRSGNYDLLTGRGILHCAAREGRLGFVETLIKAGAPVDAPDGHGLTALQVSRQHPEQCEAESVLLRAGACDNAPNEVPCI